MSVDAPRLLAARSELGYVERLALALQHEPEAVPADYQQAITGTGHTASRRRRTTYQERRDTIEAELNALVRDDVLPRRELRLIRRELDRLDRRFAR